MVRAKGTIDIAAPANVVWNWIVEPEKYLVWNTDFKEYRIIDEKEGKVGSTYHVVAEKPGGIVEGDCVITECVENRRYSFRLTAERTEAEGTFTIEPTTEGCRVTFEENLELKGAVGKIIGALFVKKAKMRNIEESLQKLKEVVERAEA